MDERFHNFAAFATHPSSPLSPFWIAGLNAAIECQNADCNLTLVKVEAVGDIDGDGDIDRDDLEILLQDRGKSVNQSACGARCDLNGDGQINFLDVRILIQRCSRPQCATQ
jgi:hypothetical protein